MVEKAFIRYDGSKWPFPHHPIPAPKKEAEYIYFYIDENGDLIMEKNDIPVGFQLTDGDLYVEAI